MSSAQEELLRQHPILTEVVHRLVVAFQPERIYLFGSRARHEETLDSDFDLLMIVRESPLPRYRRDQAAFRVLAGVGISKDILVLTHDEFDRQRKVVSSLAATVEREGTLLYGA